MMMQEFTLWDIIHNLLNGFGWSLLLSLIVFVLGGICGLLILMLRISKDPILQKIAIVYIEFFQGTPLLVQLFMTFFGLALLGFDTSAWVAASFSLTAYAAAYFAEIWRGCVQSVPVGQWEAAGSLALSRFQQFRYVILPQALRIAIAPTVGFSVQIVKATAVTSIIGFTELTKTGSILANATFEPFLVFGLVAVGYFILCFPLSALASYLEKKLHGTTSHT
ncbi:amino acid ABC transporter permease [Acinetobacter boissieri]|uniref:Amino acid ABC transporter membrane protein 2, PAAT family n=1 Tax=Acinetobacter boissieri TaxID=1219383 RepID=A0A1G6GKW6_9GAMM|nr:amino acid ABC transporter permease [Acinetobacter boissieri]SDB82637.1 amino acid ABC transporter membrane protein 2, PAAT family [Acinetobacter boissieri]